VHSKKQSGKRAPGVEHKDAWAAQDDDELILTLGQAFSSPSKTLTDAHFVLFSGVTGDNHPIHYDVEYARRTRFQKPLAHGLLVTAMTALGASSVSRQIEGFVFVEQGSRFLKPVVVGDTVTPRFHVEKIWSEGGKRFVRITTALVNQRGETALEGFHIYQVLDHDAERTNGRAESSTQKD
jgi:3-hydroxybutyryl-CoA dehydratase